MLVPAPHVPAKRAQGAGPAHGLRRAGRPRCHRVAVLHLRLARGPHRALGCGLPLGAAAQGQAHLRARRLGPHCRRHQPARQGQAQPLDQRPAAGQRRGLVRGRHRGPRQLVAGLVGLAGAAGRQAGGRAQGARQRQVQAHRGGPRPLRQGQGLTPTPVRTGCGSIRRGPSSVKLQLSFNPGDKK
ncbi:hypothetical protein RA210_U230006 [Rubrivivax sp. A210]|nr:hypothetical protein RA210_U230006 [Rubrivivax sp. A210]